MTTRYKKGRKLQAGITTGAIALIFILGAGSFAGWKAWQNYSKRVEQEKIAMAANISIKQIQGLVGQYEDQIKLASSTGRIALSGPVEKLQTTRRQLQAIVVPACLERSKGLVSQGMEVGVNIFLEFMQEKTSDEESGVRGARMAKHLSDAADAFEDCPKVPS